MIGLRRVPWMLPIALGALTLALLAAVVVARSERPSRALSAATPGIVNAGPGAAPEIADLNAQLAQIAALRAATTYGAGLTHVVRGPVPSLRASLGEEWRELQGSVGQARVRPTGTPSRYFEVGLVAVAQHGPARLAIITSVGQRAIEPVNTGPYQRDNFGPLLAPKPGPIGLAFSSLQPQSDAPGPTLVLSPLQAEYLAPGEWVRGMPALEEIGPGGKQGLYLNNGSTTRFAMTPGISGGCELALEGASVDGALQVTITVGREARSALVSSQPSVVHLRPFSRASGVLSLTVSALSAKSNASLFISHMTFVAVRPRP
jgi:hypothetical protein